ncbi:MAG: hypothetical protein D6820_08400 [Lentisphaerae bacterium]|nr:MAG: hypothetical protein D6820_08400 [Lentisphaerota bacterium]
MEDFWKLFGMLIRSRAFILGREAIFRKQRKLEFILIREDITRNSLYEIRKNLKEEIPVFIAGDLSQWYKHHLDSVKVLGVRKGPLGKELCKRLRQSGAGPDCDPARWETVLQQLTASKKGKDSTTS